MGKSIVCLCLNLLTKRKRRKNPLEAKRIVLSQAFILEKKKFKKKKKKQIWCDLCLQAKVRSCCWVPPSQSLITMLCFVFFVNPVFLILQYHNGSARGQK